MHTTKFIFYLLYLFLAALGLHCCLQAFSSCGARVSHFGVFSCCRARAGRLSGCPKACAIYPDQGLNPCPFPWRQILNHWTTREVLPSPLDKGEVRFQKIMRTRGIAVAIFRKIKSATTSIKFLPYLSNCRCASYLWYRSKIMPVSWNPHQIKGKKCIEDMIENISFRRELLFWPCFNKTYIFHLGIPISEWVNFPQTSFALYVSDLISFPPSYSPCIVGQCLPCTCVTMPDKLV